MSTQNPNELFLELLRWSEEPTSFNLKDFFKRFKVDLNTLDRLAEESDENYELYDQARSNIIDRIIETYLDTERRLKQALIQIGFDDPELIIMNVRYDSLSERSTKELEKLVKALDQDDFELAQESAEILWDLVDYRQFEISSKPVQNILKKRNCDYE